MLIAKSSEKQGLCFSASNVRTEAAAHPSNLRMLAHGH